MTAALLSPIVLLSCMNGRDDVVNVELEGEWALVNASCNCDLGESPDLGGHRLIFEGSALNVANHGETAFLGDGSGHYSVEGNTITLESGERYSYVIDHGDLKLSLLDNPNVADDELQLTYIRIR